MEIFGKKLDLKLEEKRRENREKFKKYTIIFGFYLMGFEIKKSLQQTAFHLKSLF